MINKKIIFLVILIVMFLSLNLISATITIDIDIKESFGLDEIIGFDYTIKSDVDITVQYSPTFTCGEFQFSPVLIEKELIKNIAYQEYYEGTNTNIFDGQISCNAALEIIGPVYVFESKNFVVNALPTLMFNMDVCKDLMCSEKSKIFVQGEEVYLNYESDVENLLIDVKLITPTNRTESLTLPISIKAEQVGTYELQITASKEGYKSTSLNEQFGVIKGEVDISYVDVEKTSFLAEDNLIYYLIGGCVILLLLFIMYLIVRKKRRKNINFQPLSY